MPVVITLIAIILFLYHLYVYQVRSRVAHIPGPSQHWIYLLGNAQELIKSKRINQRRLLVRYFKRYGPIFKIVVFHKVLLFCYGPAVNRMVFSSSSRFPKPQSVYGLLHSMFGVRFMGRSFLTETDHQRWRDRRRRVCGIFSAGFANGSVDAVNSACVSLVRLLGGLADSGQRLQLEKFLGKATLEVTCRVGFGFSSGALERQGASDIQAMVQGAMDGVAIKTESPFAWLGRPAKVAEVRNRLIKFRHLLAGRVAAELADDAEGSGEVRCTSMMSEMAKKLAGRLSEDELVDEAVTLFSAGQETTASLLSSLFMELGRQPEVMDALVAEIDSVCHPSTSVPITLEEVSHMRYLAAVVKETLRIYPPAPMVTRVGTEGAGPVEIGGYSVPPGYPLYLNLQATHLLCFKDGKSFKPDRFLDSPDGAEPFAYGPFGFGERACAGQRLALLTTKLALAHILRAFRLRYPPDLAFHTVQIGSLKPLHGVPVMLEARKCDAEA